MVATFSAFVERVICHKYITVSDEDQAKVIEEFARHGVDTLFVKAPQGNSAEESMGARISRRGFLSAAATATPLSAVVEPATGTLSLGKFVKAC
jgi:hypothetical protein